MYMGPDKIPNFMFASMYLYLSCEWFLIFYLLSFLRFGFSSVFEIGSNFEIEIKWAISILCNFSKLLELVYFVRRSYHYFQSSCLNTIVKSQFKCTIRWGLTGRRLLTLTSPKPFDHLCYSLIKQNIFHYHFPFF